jgi:hypothetical protein
LSLMSAEVLDNHRRRKGTTWKIINVWSVEICGTVNDIKTVHYSKDLKFWFLVNLRMCKSMHENCSLRLYGMDGKHALAAEMKYDYYRRPETQNFILLPYLWMGRNNATSFVGQAKRMWLEKARNVYRAGVKENYTPLYHSRTLQRL